VQSYLGQVYGNDLWLVITPLPDGRVEPFGHGIFVPQDRLWLAGIAVVLTAALWAMYRWTNFGRATTAVAESHEIASSLGWSPNLIAAVNWGLGCALGGMAGILISPLIGLNVGALTNLLLASLAVALVAGFRSLPITLAAGIALGVLRSELTRFLPELDLPDEIDLAGLVDTLPFLVIIVVLAINGQALPVRGFVQERLPKIGAGRIRPGVVVPLALVVTVLILQIDSPSWQGAVVSTMGLSVILLSAVVIVGYAGQISLAQFALAGFGAWVAARLIVDTGMPFELAALLAIVAGVAIGVVFALPAVRVRGVRLAIITFGLATALHRMIFANVPLTGGRTGLEVGPRSIFGIDIDPIEHQERYAAFGFVVFVLVGLAVANVRRGRAGRRLIAVRANERAAAAMGISAWAVKVYAFGLSSAVAAIGGILLFFKTSPIVFEFIFPARSITVLTTAVIGGIGYVVGPVIGALWLPGSVGARFVGDVLGVPSEWLAFVGGAFVLLIIMRHQDGAAHTFARAGQAIGGKITARSERRGQPGPVLKAARRLAGHTAAGEIEEITTAGRAGRPTAHGHPSSSRAPRAHGHLRRHYRSPRHQLDDRARTGRRAHRPQWRRQDDARRRGHRVREVRGTRAARRPAT
jgi:sulfate-transporting ATPase